MGAKSTEVHQSNTACYNGHIGLRYNKTGECVQCKRDWANRWARANRDVWLEKKREYNRRNRETINAKSRERQKARPDLHRGHQLNRRVRKRYATLERIPTSDIASALEYQCGLCAYCGIAKDITVDHVVPLSRGGEHSTDNILGCCKSCNSSKGSKSLIVWLCSRRRF